MELWEKHWSPELAKEMVWLSGSNDSFAKAEKTLARIGRIHVSDSSVWHRVQKWGAQLKVREEQLIEASQAACSREERLQKKEVSGECKGSAMDGAIIYIRGEGWKELKVGSVFDVVVTPTKEKASGGWQDKAHAINNQFVAHLGGPEKIGQLTWGLARKQHWFKADKTIVLGDGAAWIWNQADHHFADSQQLVDWYHATEHLAKASRLLYPESSTDRHQWYDQQKATLFAGHAAAISQHLLDLALTRPLVEDILAEATYFENHHERMAYQTRQQEGYPIGSGMVESACKQFKARFDGSGMRWSRKGAENLLPIRSAVMGDSFDSIWQDVYHLPQN